MVYIEYLEGDQWLVDEFYNNVVNLISEKEGVSFNEVSCIHGSDEWLLEYNKNYLNHDYYTDIITFDYSTEDSFSGDLLISLTRVEDNAKNLNVSRETELKRVVIHGLLHLCGYKDKSKDEIELMRKKEDYYLSLL